MIKYENENPINNHFNQIPITCECIDITFERLINHYDINNLSQLLLVKRSRIHTYIYIIFWDLKIYLFII